MFHPRVITFFGYLALITSVLAIIAYAITGKIDPPTRPFFHLTRELATALILIYAGREIQRLHKKLDKKQVDKTRTASRLEARVHSLLRLQRGMTGERERFAILHALIDLWDAGVGWTDTNKALLTKEAIRDIAKLADIDPTTTSSSDWRNWISYQRYSADESSQAA